jgi:protein-S-isoprenylcysteine O-methyltransferase Ste14
LSRCGLGSELVYRIVTIAGMLLLFIARRPVGRGPRLWEPSLEVGWCLVVVAVAGFAFCWWARIHLGRMWSSSVTRKDHYIVDTGPYAVVRHPIYTGIIIAAAATAP